MSAVHREWKESQAAALPAPAAVHRFALPPLGAAPALVAAPAGDDTPRHYPRSFDEAFRTAEWRNPIDGPYHGPRLWREAVRWVVVALLALVLVGATL